MRKLVTALGAVGLLLLAGCATTDSNGNPVDPCKQATQVLTGASIAISVAQAGVAVLETAGTIKPGSKAETAINVSFNAAAAAVAQGQADIAAGKCDVAAYATAATAALAQAAKDIAAAKAEAEAEKKKPKPAAG